MFYLNFFNPVDFFFFFLPFLYHLGFGIPDMIKSIRVFFPLKISKFWFLMNLQIFAFWKSLNIWIGKCFLDLVLLVRIIVYSWWCFFFRFVQPSSSKSWDCKFKFVLGIIHTNYLSYVRFHSAHSASIFPESFLYLFNQAICRAYCHKIIKISAALQDFAPNKEVICNVHGMSFTRLPFWMDLCMYPYVSFFFSYLSLPILVFFFFVCVA